MELNNKNVLITGGAGFLGSSVAQALVKQHANITVVDTLLAPYGGNMFNLSGIHDKITFINDDIRNKLLIEKLVQDKDYIIHLAAQTGRLISLHNPELDYDINCRGTWILLDALKKKNRKAKLIFASSRGVIGMPEYFPVDEKHVPKPRDIYGIHKLTAEHYCNIYAREYGIPITILRFNNIYGPRCQIKSNHYGTINLFIAYALQKQTCPIYGDGMQTRDYVYIDDAVEAIIRSMKRSKKNETYFVGSGEEYSLFAIKGYIETYINEASFTLVPFPKDFGTIDFPRFVSSNKKIYDDLLWKPKTSLRDGIKKTTSFYRKFLSYYL